MEKMIRIKLIDEDTGKEVLNRILENPNITLDNDLEKLPFTNVGSLVSKGLHVKLSGYIRNDKLDEDFDKEMDKLLGHKEIKIKGKK